MGRAMVVLAAGEGTRLGMLAQPNKALVTVQQRPMLAHFVGSANRTDVRALYVVMSHGADSRMVEHVARHFRWKDTTIVRAPVNGPGGATIAGVNAALADGHSDVTVLMADTLLSHQEMDHLVVKPGTWAGIAVDDEYDRKRSYCKLMKDGSGCWDEGLLFQYELPFVGIMGLHLDAPLRQPLDDVDVPMSPILNRIMATPYPVKTWTDVGDIEALARANRRSFTARSHHKLTLDDGWLHKDGVGSDEITKAKLLSDEQHTTPRMSKTSPVSYDVEYWPAPSLAQLWLYDDLPASAWSHIAQQLKHCLCSIHEDSTSSSEWCVANRSHLIDKPRRRQAKSPSARLVPNERGGPYMSPIAAVEFLGKFIDLGARTTRSHGDPNFSNVLCDPSTMSMRLIDPRGPEQMHHLYDVAKVRYSYAHEFSAVCHDLFHDARGHAPHPSKVAAIDEVLLEGVNVDQVLAIEASILLSAWPLHSRRQGDRLTMNALRIVKELDK